MADGTTQDGEKPKAEQGTGDGVGGADSGGSGNILAGVQPDAGTEDQEDERRED
jgi:hypothetical protein